MWDVVITSPIHHAVPAGMRWGQSLHNTITACSGVLCSAPLCSVFVLLSFVRFPRFKLSCFLLCMCASLLCSTPHASVRQQTSHLCLFLPFFLPFFFFFFCCLFLNLLLKLSLNDLLLLCEGKTSQLAEHVLFLFVSLRLKLAT